MKIKLTLLLGKMWKILSQSRTRCSQNVRAILEICRVLANELIACQGSKKMIQITNCQLTSLSRLVISETARKLRWWTFLWGSSRTLHWDKSITSRNSSNYVSLDKLYKSFSFVTRNSADLSIPDDRTQTLVETLEISPSGSNNERDKMEVRKSTDPGCSEGSWEKGKTKQSKKIKSQEKPTNEELHWGQNKAQISLKIP